MNRKNTLRYRFSDKHKEYLRRTVDHHYNVAEGSIRSGKSTDNVLAFAQDIKHSRDKVYLATAFLVHHLPVDYYSADGKADHR